MKKPTRIFLLLTLCLILQKTPTHAYTMTDHKPEESADPQPRFLTTQAVASNHPDPSYLLTLDRWRKDHAAALTQPDGWLSLIALEWLKPGDTTVGSAPGSSLRLEHAPPHLATFRLTGNTVLLIQPTGGFPHDATLNGHPVLSVPVPLDAEFQSGTYLIVLIKRGDRLYLRVKDSAAPTRQAFRGLHWYSPDLQYRVTARWVPSAMAGNLAVTNVLGQLSHESSPGMAEFTLYGQTIRLFPIMDGDSKNTLFFIFRDTTSNSRTYGAGRFLYTGLPSNGLGRTGTIVLDFNRAENPPCAYTPYATCPLPPQQNRLTLPIPAGEQRYHD
ncbi:DUF1684 domain-containing protein [Granulicella arctica]|uniref:DUF1684 domain-containing protein n=1 Tax=Granulicella arctica TaxID=940613 RepID=UPI0021E05BD9|nr:DUF1684 domain-containing protein [Granulicella arctica]